jgi:cytochrome c peroxidase
VIALVLVFACSSPVETPSGYDPSITEEEWAALRALAPPSLPAPPPDASNAFADDPAAASFGRTLFFDAGFSGELLDGDNDGSVNAPGRVGETGKVSCASCHVPEDGFSDTRSLRGQISLGAGWGLRKAPSLLDVGQSRLLMWDGRRDSMYSQVFGPFESEVEMNSSRLFAARHVFATHRERYEEVFGPMPALDDPRFPPLLANETGCRALDSDSKCTGVMRGAPGDGAEFDGMSEADRDAVTRVVVNAGKAIGAYERLLSCGPSRFDAWVNGDPLALTEEEIEGARIFVGRGGCTGCHSGPYFSDERFHNIGLRPAVVAAVFLDADDRGAALGLETRSADPLRVEGEFSDGDDGRAAIALGPELEGAFRTPRLRCVAGRPSFMHTGQMLTLEEVIAFHVRGGDPAGYPGRNELTRLDLDAEERAALAAFLRALDGPGPDPSLLAP